MATGIEFASARKRYFSWKSTQPLDRVQTAQAVEEEALAWGYEAGRRDVEQQVVARLLGEERR